MKTNSTFYPKTDSFFYKLSNRSRLEEFLGVEKGYLKKSNIEKLVKYKVFVQDKNGKAREIEAPCKELKVLQKKLYKYFRRIETPDWLISGKKGLSYVDNCKVHESNDFIVVSDIEKFYPSCSQKRVFDFFKNEFKMSADIAGLMTRLTTRNGHVATGTPTSQIIAFWCCEKMFRSIYQLAKENGINFTLYVDDMTFSSKSPISKLFVWEVNKICRNNGFKIKAKKTKYYSKDDYKIITGVCISPDKHKLIPNKLQRKIYNEKELLLKAGIEYNDFRRIKGLVLAAQQIEKQRYHNIDSFIDSVKTELNDV